MGNALVGKLIISPRLHLGQIIFIGALIKCLSFNNPLITTINLLFVLFFSYSIGLDLKTRGKVKQILKAWKRSLTIELDKAKVTGAGKQDPLNEWQGLLYEMTRKKLPNETFEVSAYIYKLIG